MVKTGSLFFLAFHNSHFAHIFRWGVFVFMNILSWDNQFHPGPQSIALLIFQINNMHLCPGGIEFVHYVNPL